jgi:hypothetical protein
MDFEREEQRGRYRLCRVGFGLIALGLGLLLVNSALWLAFLLTSAHDILTLLKNPLWDWVVGAPITWTTLIGSYLLWGRSTDPSWQRRAALLVIMNGIDMINWAVRHGDALGLRLGPVGHDWLRSQVSEGLGWAEFLLFTSMAVDMLEQLGKNPSAETGAAARSLSTIGLVFWAIVFMTATDWTSGWPLEHRQMGQDKWILILFGTSLLTTITSLQVAVLCGSAFLHCGRVLAEMNQEDLAEDLLRSRSETFADDPDRWFNRDNDPWS